MMPNNSEKVSPTGNGEVYQNQKILKLTADPTPLKNVATD